jgi:hypothetical protein
MEKKSHGVKHFGLLIYYAVVDLENRLRRGSTVGSKNLKMGRLGCLPFSIPPQKYVLGLYFADRRPSSISVRPETSTNVRRIIRKESVA